LILTTLGAAAVAFVAWEGDAHAQSRFGDKGQLAITAENLFAFSTERRAEALPTGDVIDVTNRLGLLVSERDGAITPHLPQVGGHYFIAPSISIGGTIGYETHGGSTRAAPVGPLQPPSVAKDDVSSFVLAPKVGYVLPLTGALGFWFRGGLTFFHLSDTNAGNNQIKDSFSLWLVSADALFVVSPVQHFSFYLGPQADISLGGSHSVSRIQMGALVEDSVNMSFRSVGIGAGMIGYFDL
jgi:hypothetical protein